MAKPNSQTLDVVFAVEGDRKPRSVKLKPGDTVASLLEALRRDGREGLDEVAVEDAEEALSHDTKLEDVLSGEFKVLHAGRRGEIMVTVMFNARSPVAAFRPSDTVRKVTRWAVGAHGLDGDASDFQLKLGDEVLPPETHLGQVAKGHKALELALVMKVKPQG